MARVGEAFVDIKADVSGFSSALSSGVTNALDGAEREAKGFTDRLGDSLRSAGDKISGVGTKVSSAGSTLSKNVTLPLVGVGTAGFMAARSVEDALRTIRVGTGATGGELEQLNSDFEFLARNSSQSVDRVGTVVADLNTRLGLTGAPMRDLAEQVLDLEQITGGTETNLDTLTRVFGAFQVAPEEYGETLDKLFRASQSTGVEFNSLQGTLVSQSAAFSELGFNIDDTVAILGQFEAAGVNTETVLGGLRANIVKAAGEGESAADFFRAGVSTIEDFLEAGDEAGAQAAAKELFGARTFLDALDAIKRGQFNIDDTVSKIVDGQDTIGGLAEETSNFSNDFAQFRNNMAFQLAPIGEKLIPLLTKAMEKIIPIIDRVLGAFERMSPGMQTAAVAVGAVLAALGPVLMIVGPIIVIIGKLVAAIAFFVSPIGLIVLGIGALIAIIVIVVRNFDRIKEVLSSVGEAIGAFIDGALEWIKEAFNAVWETVTNVFDGIKDAIVTAFDFIVDFVTSTLTAIGEAFTAVFQAIHDFINATVDAIKSVITTVMDTIKSVITTVLDTIKKVWDAALKFVLNTVKKVFNTIKGFITTVINIYLTVIRTVLGKIRDVFFTIMNTIRDVVFGAFEKVKDIIVGVITWIHDSFTRGLGIVLNLFMDVFNGIVDFFAGVVTRLANVGKDIFGFIKDSFKSALNFVIRGWNSLKFSIPSFGIGPLKFPGFSMGVPQIPLLANGAIVTGPMLAGIGEAGPEAVIPLTRPGRALQLLEQSGLADLARNSNSGAAVNIQNATFMKGTDADFVAQKVLAAWRSRSVA